MKSVFGDKLFLAIVVAGIVILAVFAYIRFNQGARLSIKADIPKKITEIPPLVPAIPPSPEVPKPIVPPPAPALYNYVEVVDSCGPYFDNGACVNLRSGPGESYEVVMHLRTGLVLKVAQKVTGEGHDWYQILFDEWLRYPERVKGDWYVAADYVRFFSDKGTEELGNREIPPTGKRILIKRSEQKLYAYEGDKLFMEEPTSTGLELTPTPRGTFKIYRKTPGRYMQGPLPDVSDQYYDLPGVPWNLYFTNEGGVIHGAYWHDKFGQVWSHGCVNLAPDKAWELYVWADLGTPVTVQD